MLRILVLCRNIPPFNPVTTDRIPMAIQGNSKTIAIPDLFNFICHRRLSGMLVVASRTQDRSFFFHEGELIYALASDPGELVGEVLVRELGLDPATVERVSRGTGRFLGESLIQQGVVTKEGLDHVMERQIRLILREVLRWDEWAFHFEKLEPSPSTPTLRLSTQLLVFDLTREMDEWESLDDTLPDLELVPERPAGSFHLGREWPAELPPPGEILEAVDGERSFRRLLQESPLPVRSHARGLRQALDAGLIVAHHRTAHAEHDSQDRWLMVPVIPNLASRILALESHEQESLGAYYDLVKCDPVLVARILRSASLRRQTRRDTGFSLRSTVWGIGLQPVKAILFADAMRDLFLVPSSITWRQLWEQAYKSSFTCRCIAELIDYPELDLAQVAGLLHDLGCIALAGRDRTAYQQVYEYARSTGGNLLEAERSIFHTDHCAVGAELAQQWGFPEPVTSVIRDHHSPPGGGPDEVVVTIVRLANYLVAPGGSETQLTRSELKRLRRQIGIDVENFDRVRSRVEEWSYCLQTSGVLADFA